MLFIKMVKIIKKIIFKLTRYIKFMNIYKDNRNSNIEYVILEVKM